jgi:microcystin-dependent protein
MSDQFLAEIRVFPYTFAPQGWAMCNGQILPISQNTALFSLLGTNFGGNGTSNFALPNLQGSIAIGQGQGPGLVPYTMGEQGGVATVTLSSSTLPAHTHTLPVSAASTSKQATPSSSSFLGATGGGRTGGVNAYATPAQQATSPATMLSGAVGASGGGGGHNNMAPYLVFTYCIALQGIYPARS